uniref:Cytochrome c biogenesis protein CcsA n=2 Tax=Volvox carteri TaxID=3067 RepID=D0VMY7_VOLCA|nr:cytochrome c biogenesis protein [Volvox carteri]ACY06052.1 cytochrome c biogenesis protein [Volvox carteri f. nagariensis]
MWIPAQSTGVPKIVTQYMLLNNLLNLEEFENSLRNATFLTLFFTTIFYWIYTAFSTPTNFKTNKLLFDSNILFARSSMAVSNLLLVLLLLVRWEISGHFPLSNLYESLMFLAWCCTFLYLIYSTSFIISVEKILGSITAPSALLMNAFATFSLPKEMQQSAPLVPALQSNWLMMHVSVMIISYATLIIGSLLSILFLILNKLSNSKLNLFEHRDSLQLTNNSSAHPKTNFKRNAWVWGHNSQIADTRFEFIKTDKKIPPLSKAPNVCLHDFSTNKVKNNKQNINTNNMTALAPKEITRLRCDGEKMPVTAEYSVEAVKSMANNSIVTPEQIKDFGDSKLTLLKLNLDLLSYRIIGLGFPFLTIGILSGAVWANEAWGSYWSWDPKETWALLTWLVFAIYLHTRLTKGWQGEKPAVIASLGFMVVWFCYLGVNLIGKGLHSYGFFN